MKEYQVLGGPAWADSYEILAKAPGESAPSREQAREMLQTLLAERLQLKLHRETKELPVYQLMVAKGGPKLKESTTDVEFGMNVSVGQTIEVKFSSASMAALVADAPSIFTAMTEQLGLKLESAKSPVEVLVIDHVAKPSEN